MASSPDMQVPSLRPEIEALRRDIERLRAVGQSCGGILDAILEFSPHGVIVADAKGKLILQNRASERIWAGSATAESMEEFSLYRAYHADGRVFQPHDWPISRCLTTGEAIEAEELLFQRFDGTRGVLLVSCAPIYRDTGALDGAIVVFADITRVKRTAERTEQLLSISEALSHATTSPEVVEDTIVPLATALGADTGGLWLLDDGALRLTRHLGYSELRGHFDAIPLEEPVPMPLPVRDVHRTQQPVFLGSLAELAARYPELGAMLIPRRAALAVAALPLVVETRCLGVLAFSFQESRTFDDADRAFLVLVARLCAQALQRARLLAAEREARERAAVLFAVTDRITRAATLDEVYAAALDAIARALGVDRASILVFDAAGVMRFIAWRGLSDGYRAAVEGHSPWTADTRDPEPLVVPDAAADASLAGYRDLFAREGIGALGFFPLVNDGRLLGKFMTYYRAPHRFSELELETARTIAGQVSFAIDRSRREAMLVAARAEAEEAARARENLVGVVSHDLRNPLGAIVTSAAVIRKKAAADPGAAVVAKQADTILRSAERMNWLIRDLLDLARLDAGRLVLARAPEDAASVVEEAVELMRPAAEQRSVRLVARAAPGISLDVDRERILQVLANLLGNALKFSPDGAEVAIAAAAEGGRARVTVSDQGPGIAPDELPRIFDRYWKGRGGSGVGLGLSIVKALVEAHEGEVRVESEPGSGSRFTLVLPLA